MSANYSITLHQGTDFARSFQIKEDDTVLDITGYSFTAKLAPSYYDSTVTSMTTAIEDAAQGTFTVKLTDTQTADLTAGEYVYDVVMTKANGDKVKLLHGYAQVEDTL